MRKIRTFVTKYLLIFFTFTFSLFHLSSCIEPPLKLPAQEVIVDFPMVITDIDVVWNLDVDWRYNWYYGWDKQDSLLWGSYDYPDPTNFEVRRYYLGEQPGAKHTNVDAFTIFGNRFRRSYQFGYYDMLIYSNIDSEDGSQVVKVDESNLDITTATTSISRGLTRLYTNLTDLAEQAGSTSSNAVTGLYNQPEIFYSAYPQDIYISRFMEDYDYYDEAEHCWVKHINCDLDPLVYIYLVQVIFLNNDGRVTGTSGNAAMTAFASKTNVNTAHTYDDPVIVYFNTRYKEHCLYELQDCQIIGGKFTTFGLCDLEPVSRDPDHYYNGVFKDVPNYLLVDVRFRNGAEQTFQFDVTKQVQEQSHGGIITVIIDCGSLDIPDNPGTGGTGSLFVPTVEDYDEVIYEIPLHS